MKTIFVIYFGCTVVWAVILEQSTAQLTSRPQNVVSIFGERVELKCGRTINDRPVDWKFASFGSSDFIIIYYGGTYTHNVSSRYMIDSNVSGHDNLIIDSVGFSQAGTYQCIPAAHNKTLYATAQLIVLPPTQPICGTIPSSPYGFVEYDYIPFWCRVIFSGNAIPQMNWTKNDGQNLNASLPVVNPKTSFTEVISTLLTQLKNSSDNGSVFSCSISFKVALGNVSAGEGSPATNDPAYLYTWNYTVTFSGPWRPHRLYLYIAVGVAGLAAILIPALICIGFRLSAKKELPTIKATRHTDPDVVQTKHTNRNGRGSSSADAYANWSKNQLIPDANGKKDKGPGHGAGNTRGSNDQFASLYAKVDTKREAEYKSWNSSCDPAGVRKTKSNQQIGVEGTLCQEMNMIPESFAPSMNRRPLPNPRDTYAYIDDNLVVPTPPLMTGSLNNRKVPRPPPM